MVYHQLLHSHLPFMVLVFFSHGLSFEALSQDTMTECGPSLLPLAPCGPFVQGMAASPAQSCCHGLDQLHSQRLGCLCLLLHDSSLPSSFPINTTLALQLPAVCELGFDASTCGGTTSHAPPARASFSPKRNSSFVAASSPLVTMASRPNFEGVVSADVSPKAKKVGMVMAVAAAAWTMGTQHV